MDILAEAQLSTVIFHYFGVLIQVAVNFIVALLYVRWLRSRCPKLINKHMRLVYLLIAAGFLLVASIGKLGWSVQTYNGHTDAERLNECIFIILSHIGTWFLFVDLNSALAPKGGSQNCECGALPE